ncbi:protein binding protein, putative [Ricinus communis]|uniref:Protein binding protein, putative n=2 Tax=Ricinus communis TaxID=3988 RepID=B9SLI9_RICCO|nr:protein binding protein, putative [Ricinus communis]
MHALIRFAVIFLAEKLGFFSFDSTWNPTGDFLFCGRAVLVENEEGNSRDMVMSLNPEKLITLINISDRFPDLEVKWFLKMRNIKVLCLGRWEENTTSHIEVEDTKFLNGLKNMKHLEFLSLQGVSRVCRLPDNVTKLINLRTLDLKACHNLEALPDSIGSLRNLAHLDISECYLLDRMPKGIELLSQLEVLKGFVVTDKKMRGAGSISDLSRLLQLRKLSINATKRDFPTAEELDALQGCISLQKLTIVWAGTSDAKPVVRSSGLKRLNRSFAFARKNNRLNRASTVIGRESMASGGPKLPVHLKKLDLQCFPETEAPSWLMPSKLESLEKLYIRGGKLQFLNEAGDEGPKWNVMILRLKFSTELSMHWREVQSTFPELIYLEKVDCPNLTFFPCDENGIWLNSEMLPQRSLALGLRWSFLSTQPT